MRCTTRPTRTAQECIAAALQKPQNPDCLRLNQVLIRRPGSSLAWKLPVGAANRPTRHRARARRPRGVAWRVPSVPGEPSPPTCTTGHFQAKCCPPGSGTRNRRAGPSATARLSSRGHCHVVRGVPSRACPTAACTRTPRRRILLPAGASSFTCTPGLRRRMSALGRV